MLLFCYMVVIWLLLFALLHSCFKEKCAFLAQIAKPKETEYALKLLR